MLKAFWDYHITIPKLDTVSASIQPRGAIFQNGFLTPNYHIINAQKLFLAWFLRRWGCNQERGFNRADTVFKIMVWIRQLKHDRIQKFTFNCSLLRHSGLCQRSMTSQLGQIIYLAMWQKHKSMTAYRRSINLLHTNLFAYRLQFVLQILLNILIDRF